MQQHIKYLVVEDQPDWSKAISAEVRAYFEDVRRIYKARIVGASAYDGDQGREQLDNNTFDLVTLDMNLGEGAGKSKISGLDLLGDIADGNRAYFVIIVTGAVNDPNIERIYGPEAAARMRYGALNEAVRKLPAERVRILHKPDIKDPPKAMRELLPHLHSALDQYCWVSLERNIFRPLPGDPKMWEVRFNGGSRLTFKTETPYRTIQSALAQPNRALEVTRLMQALAHSSGRGGATTFKDESETPSRARKNSEADYRGHQEDEVSGGDGLDWVEMEGFSVSDTVYTPVDLAGGAIPIESIIGPLLVANRERKDMAEAVKSITECGIDEASLLAIPKVASEWATKGNKANAEFGFDDAPERLRSLVRALKPVLSPIRERWLAQREQKAAKTGVSSKKSGSKSTIRVARGNETREAQLARQHKKRFLSKIKSRPALREFYDHMMKWIPADPTTRGHLYYRPPGGGELCPFWLTE